MIIDYDDRHNRHCSNLQPSRHDTSLRFLFLIVMLTEDPHLILIVMLAGKSSGTRTLERSFAT